jgi:hypothetical protein
VQPGDASWELSVIRAGCGETFDGESDAGRGELYGGVRGMRYRCC